MNLVLLNSLSETSGLSIPFIENILGTLLVFLGYFTLKPFLSKLASKKISEGYREEVIAHIIPSSLKFTAFGFLAKIWMTGGASIESTFEISKPLMGQIVQTIYVFLFYLAGKFSAEVFIDIRFAGNAEKQFTFRRTSAILVSFFCFLLLLRIWLNQTTNLSAYLGLLSAGLAVALQDVISSFAGWLYILSVKPLKIGDRIQIGDKIGDISDIKFLQFSVVEMGMGSHAEQATGRILYFPNSFVFKNCIANYDAGFDYIFAEIPITLTFESNWQLAQGIFKKILAEEVSGSTELAARQIRKASKEMRLQFTHLEPRVITSVSDFGVVLTLRILCKVRERRFTEAKIWERILKALEKESSIDFAYPTTRYYYNPKEGKSETGGPSITASVEEVL